MDALIRVEERQLVAIRRQQSIYLIFSSTDTRRSSAPIEKCSTPSFTSADFDSHGSRTSICDTDYSDRNGNDGSTQSSSLVRQSATE